MEKETKPLPTTPLAPSNDLSTPQCPAEHRAWLLIYQMRFGCGKTLVKAFSNQFPDSKTHHTLYHARHLRYCDEAVLAQLMELAKRCSWYEEPPKKGERYYKRIKRLERQEAARERLLARDSPWMEQVDGGEGEDSEI